MTALYIIIYLIGVIVSYKSGKILMKKYINNNKEWNLSSRNFILFVGVFSWVGCISNFIVYLALYENDQPAKW